MLLFVLGWGTDEEVIISILAHRDADQRKQIRSAFQEQHKEDLIQRLQSELSGDFEVPKSLVFPINSHSDVISFSLQRAVYCWIFDPVERQAVVADIALKNAQSDYQTVIEVACVNSPKELLAVKDAYHARYKRSLEEDVAIHTVGDFRQARSLLLLLFSFIYFSRFSFDANILSA